jgi:hypothetical protein
MMEGMLRVLGYTSRATKKNTGAKRYFSLHHYLLTHHNKRKSGCILI